MKPPFADIRFAAPRVDITTLPDGGMILRSPQRLEPYSRLSLIHISEPTRP